MPGIVNYGKATSEHMSLSAYSAYAEKQLTESTSFKLVGYPTRHPHRSQIGDKSGDRAGQGRVVTVQRQPCLAV
ncbi:hypothetical protein TNCV_3748511 [Trichonephila clavipes]|nr:hypothetical protein TNCV_3748511 [Trichonephila clavipes]